jgi:methyl-accepting chemotaxis protein
MAALALWMQETSTGVGGFSPDAEKWIVVFLGLIAFSMLVQALVYIVGGLVAMKVFKDLKGTVDEARRDLKASTEEIKGRMYPLVDGLMHAGKTAQGLIDDTVPKIKIASDHLVETSRIVRDSAEKLAHTVTEVNQKTQRQAARVDGMVTAALDTTAEVVATVEHGIKVPAQKIAQMAVQARFVAEGVFDRVKSLAAGLPFMQQRTPAPGSGTPRGPVARPAGTPPVTATTPAGATGAVPLVK